MLPTVFRGGRRIPPPVISGGGRRPPFENRPFPVDDRFDGPYVYKREEEEQKPPGLEDMRFSRPSSSAPVWEDEDRAKIAQNKQMLWDGLSSGLSSGWNWLTGGGQNTATPNQNGSGIVTEDRPMEHVSPGLTGRQGLLPTQDHLNAASGLSTVVGGSAEVGARVGQFTETHAANTLKSPMPRDVTSHFESLADKGKRVGSVAGKVGGAATALGVAATGADMATNGPNTSNMVDAASHAFNLYPPAAPFNAARGIYDAGATAMGYEDYTSTSLVKSGIDRVKNTDFTQNIDEHLFTP